MVIDTTVRSPLAIQYKQAKPTLARAIEVAEAERSYRYRPDGGLCFTTLAAETYGRIGANSAAFLDDMSARAQERDTAC
eukprot:531484-Lingulodinium_polyedra.AAC.1